VGKAELISRLETFEMTPQEAMSKALSRLDRSPELEEIIAADAIESFRYARCIVQGRFILGEPAIATNSRHAYLYAYYVLSGRFKLGEAIIATDPDYSYHYAVRVLKGPFRLGEFQIYASYLAEDYDRFITGDVPIDWTSEGF